MCRFLKTSRTRFHYPGQHSMHTQRTQHRQTSPGNGAKWWRRIPAKTKVSATDQYVSPTSCTSSPMHFWHFKCVKYANTPSIWSPGHSDGANLIRQLWIVDVLLVLHQLHVRTCTTCSWCNTCNSHVTCTWVSCLNATVQRTILF
jgi:hypothetical protein